MQSVLAAHFARIKSLLIQHGGFLPVQDVQAILQEFDLTEDQLLQALLPLVKTFSVAPFSQFHVGAIAVGATGNFYVGANMELKTLPLTQAVHAEQSAIVMAHAHGETEITKLTSSENPCGFCRQFLYELATAHKLIMLLPDGSLTKLPHLLPHAFGAKDLGVQVDLLADKQRALQLAEVATEQLTVTALRAANHSYSPYTKSYAGVALRTKDNKIFHGSYLENAAFNPSLSPLQAAFVHLTQSGVSFADVVEAALVQVKDSAVDHRLFTASTLKAMCPQARVTIAEC